MWIVLFNSLGGVCEGYGKANVTPYMHAMVHHAPYFMKIHSGIKRFTGQGKLLMHSLILRLYQLKFIFRWFFYCNYNYQMNV